jgi:predicted esterase
MVSWRWSWFGVVAGSVLLWTGGLLGQEPATTRASQDAMKVNKTTKPARPTTGSVQRRLPRGFAARTIKLASGTERKYAVFVPPQYILDETKKWPVVLFLHGSGECGRDGVKQTKIGLPRLMAKAPERYPFISVLPQAWNLWFHGDDAATVWAALGAVHQEFRTDPDRVYLTGLSMGGFATLEMAFAHPDIFAAIVPVCGSGSTAFVSNIIDLPIWAFHGAQDKNVSSQGTRDLIAELTRLGGKPKYTEYPELGHKCWDRAYGTPELWDWLLAQRRRPPPRVIDYRFVSGSTVVWWLGVQAEKEPGTTAHVRAEANENGQVTIASEGVAGWAIKSDTYPLKIGDQIEVTWNGEHVYRGRFDGGLGVRPVQPASAPTTARDG